MSKKSIKVRATTHKGRAGKQGVYNPKHNDRNFDVSNAPHIDEARGNMNVYWHCYQKSAPNVTFEDAEKRFYERHFWEALEAKNERYRKGRHPERQWTMDKYRASKRYAPEEEIIQLGKYDQERPSSNILMQILKKHKEWQDSLWLGRDDVKIKVLNIALHRDEPNAADHVHKRQVYMVKDESGNWDVNQEEALKRLGFERKDPTKDRGRYNNRKQTFTEASRTKFIEIARSFGVEIETQPLEVSERGLELLEYKAKQELTKIEEIQKKIDKFQKLPEVQKMNAVERDALLREFYPDIWNHVNDLANGKIFVPEKKGVDSKKTDKRKKHSSEIER